MEIAFYLSILVITYTYLGYGIVAKFITLFIKKETNYSPSIDKPFTVTHIIAAYNEEDILKEKIENSCSLNYPKNFIKTVIVTDGSTDKTAQLASNDNRIIHYHTNKRAGKSAAVNRVIKNIDSEVIVFSDANAMINEDAINNMVRHFRSKKIGAVAGEKKVISNKSDDATSAGEGFYWQYESWLKKIDYQLHSVVGAAGELFAVRTELYQAPEQNLLIEDFITSMNIAKKGFRVAYAPDAIATETSSVSISEELKRKVRISAGGLQSVIYFGCLLNPFRYGLLTFQFVSHRVLRWTLTPMCLILAFISNLVLINTGNTIYNILFVMQILFYGMSIAGYFFQKRKIKIKIFFVPFYFSFMNASVFIGLINLISGNYQITWEKAIRK